MENALSNPAARAQMADWRSSIEPVGIISLTERPDDMLMWAHYATSHQGYCLELDAAILPFALACRVRYAGQRPSYRLFEPNRIDIIQRTLLHKADFWQYEREWRLIQFATTGPVVFPSQGLKSIILGASIKKEDEMALRAIASDRETPLAFKRTKLNDSSYQLEIIDA